MRRFNVILLGACFLLLFACAHQSDTVAIDMPETIYQEGRLNIIEVMQTWELAPLMNSIGGMPMIGFINPDEQQEIQYVIIALHQNMPIAYTYLLKGEPYVYFLDEEKGFVIMTEGVDKEQWKSNFKNMFDLTET